MTRRGLFWALWSAGALALALLAGMAAQSDYLPGDLWLAHRLQDIPGYASIADFTNAAGDAPAVVVTTFLAALVLALAGQLWGVVIVFGTFVPRFLRDALAEIVTRPRPSPDLVEVRDEASGYGFPSGHATGAIVFWGLLFVLAEAIPWRLARLFFRVFCLFMVIASGVSRVYSGVHWPSDVAGGYLLGGLGLALLLLVRPQFPKLPRGRRSG